MPFMNRSVVNRTAMLLCAMAAVQAVLVATFHAAFLPPLITPLSGATPLGWVLAVIVAALYVWFSVRALPTIGRYLWNVSAFKLTGLAIALPASILEEVFFRQYVMNALIAQPLVIQIAASGLSFGIAHAIWGIRGGRRAVVGAVGATTLMGAALEVVFIVSNRSILPCVLGHFLITVLLEPWLLYAYIERATTNRRLSVL